MSNNGHDTTEVPVDVEIDIDNDIEGGAADGESSMFHLSEQQRHDLIVILLSFLVCYVAYTFMKKSHNSVSGMSLTTMTPPKEIQEYIEFRDAIVNKTGTERSPAELDIDELDALKKKLMLRVFKTLPIIFDHQTREPLYKKGMAEDSGQKAFVEAQIGEVQLEAASLVPGWEGQIWGQGVNFYEKMQAKKEKGASGGQGVEGDEKTGDGK
jgi:hypothetical protein